MGKAAGAWPRGSSKRSCSAVHGARIAMREPTHSALAHSATAFICSVHALVLLLLATHSSKALVCSAQRVNRWNATAAI